MEWMAIEYWCVMSWLCLFKVCQNIKSQCTKKMSCNLADSSNLETPSSILIIHQIKNYSLVQFTFPSNRQTNLHLSKHNWWISLKREQALYREDKLPEQFPWWLIPEYQEEPYSAIIFTVNCHGKLKSHVVKCWLFKADAELKETGKYKWRAKTRDRGQGGTWKNSHSYLPNWRKTRSFQFSGWVTGGIWWEAVVQAVKYNGCRATQKWWSNWKSNGQ